MGERVGFGVVGAGAIGIRGALMHLSKEDVQDRVRLAAPAKVNLHLEVLRRRPDGYHEIETILQAVDLHDRLRMILRDRWTDRSTSSARCWFCSRSFHP